MEPLKRYGDGRKNYFNACTFSRKVFAFPQETSPIPIMLGNFAFARKIFVIEKIWDERKNYISVLLRSLAKKIAFFRKIVTFWVSLRNEILFARQCKTFCFLMQFFLSNARECNTSVREFKSIEMQFFLRGLAGVSVYHAPYCAL